MTHWVGSVPIIYKSDLVGYSVVTKIGRFPVQTPLGCQPG